MDVTSVMMTATSPARAPKEPTAWSPPLASDVEAHPSEHRPTALVVPASATSVGIKIRTPDAKVGKPFDKVFAKAIMCNWLVCMAV